jgi:hypothetical protein
MKHPLLLLVAESYSYLNTHLQAARAAGWWKSDEGDNMSAAQISIHGYRIQGIARWPESIEKRTTQRAARLALLRELALNLSAGGTGGRRA